MKKPIVIILLILALVFVLAGIAGTLFFTFGMGGGRVFSQPQIYATAEENKTLNVKGPVTLKVRDDAGDVTVVSGREEKKVQVKVVKTGAGMTQAGAEKDLKNIKYEIKQVGDTITLTYERENLNIDNSVDTVDFIVIVPLETSVEVRASFGEINVTDTNGKVSIVNSFGDVTLLNVEGGVKVETQSGAVDATSIHSGSASINLHSGFGSVTLKGANSKDITLTSNSGVLEMSDVRASGRVEMTTEFGDVRFENGSANSLTVETSSGKVTLEALTLRGAIAAKSEFGEIGLEQVKATSYDLDTNSGSITVDGASGKVKAHSGFGSVTVTNADSVTLDLHTQSGPVEFEGSLGEGPHTVNTDFGEIKLTLPADSALNVDLETDFGKITSEIPITVVLSGDVEKSHQTGTMNEGGAQLTVETQSGNISIQAGR
jgi:DUF4097 and DUF4098 domain-containing protein YvlB